MTTTGNPVIAEIVRDVAELDGCDDDGGMLVTEKELTTILEKRLSESRIQALEAELAAALIEVSNQARLRGEAEGKLHVSELAGIVEGWQLRAERAEAELARKTEALRPFAAYAVMRDQNDADMPDDLAAVSYVAEFRGPHVQVTLGDFRAARSALEEKTDV